jgi:hypothetical protein
MSTDPDYETTEAVTRGAKGGMVVTVKVRDPATRRSASYALTTNERAVARDRDTAKSYAVRIIERLNEDET